MVQIWLKIIDVMPTSQQFVVTHVDIEINVNLRLNDLHAYRIKLISKLNPLESEIVLHSVIRETKRPVSIVTTALTVASVVM